MFNNTIKKLLKEDSISNNVSPVAHFTHRGVSHNQNIDPDVEYVLDMVIGDYLGANMSEDGQFKLGLKKLGELLDVNIYKYDVDHILDD